MPFWSFEQINSFWYANQITILTDFELTKKQELKLGTKFRSIGHWKHCTKFGNDNWLHCYAKRITRIHAKHRSIQICLVHFFVCDAFCYSMFTVPICLYVIWCMMHMEQLVESQSFNIQHEYHKSHKSNHLLLLYYFFLLPFPFLCLDFASISSCCRIFSYM